KRSRYSPGSLQATPCSSVQRKEFRQERWCESASRRTSRRPRGNGEYHMVISDLAIKRPLITVVSMVTLVVFGLFALWRLQTDEFPDVAEPTVFTSIVYPGASPDQVEREVLDPIEEAIQGISGVDKMYGEARDGYAQIITFFVFEKNMQQAMQDIRDA